MFNPSRILVLAPHADDGELGCGGSIAKLTIKGRAEKINRRGGINNGRVVTIWKVNSGKIHEMVFSFNRFDEMSEAVVAHEYYDGWSSRRFLDAVD